MSAPIPRHIADVVADVIGDHAGIARVVLGNAFQDFARDVRAHIGGFGVDAAADTCEKRDRTRADGEGMKLRPEHRGRADEIDDT